MNMTYRVWGFRLGLQNLLLQNGDDDDYDGDDDDDVIGDWGAKGLKPKAKFLMLLCCEHDFQGLRFPVGAPKFWRNDEENDDDDDDDDDADDDADDDGMMGDWGLKGLKPKAKFLMLLCCEHELQGLGFPVGAPKRSFPKR